MVLWLPQWFSIPKQPWFQTHGMVCKWHGCDFGISQTFLKFKMHLYYPSWTVLTLYPADPDICTPGMQLYALKLVWYLFYTLYNVLCQKNFHRCYINTFYSSSQPERRTVPRALWSPVRSVQGQPSLYCTMQSSSQNNEMKQQQEGKPWN